MRPSIVKIAAWGDKHVASLHENILPCLLAPGNLPALSAASPTELILCVDRGFAFPWPPRGVPGLTVTYQLLQDLPAAADLVANRRVLARTDADSVRRAVDQGADWFSFQADTLVSAEFLRRVKRLLQTHLAVAGSPVRTSAEALRGMVGAQREFDAATLRRLSMACLHPVTASYFVRDPPTTIPADPHQMLFRTPDGFAARTWQFCPFGVSLDGLRYATQDMVDEVPTGGAIDGETTIDCYFVQGLPGRRVRFHEPATDEFYLTSLDAAAGIPKFGEFEMTASSIVNSILKFSRDYGDVINYGIALRQRFAYPTDVQLPDSLGEGETVDAVRKALVP